MSKFWLIDWAPNLYYGGRFNAIPLTGSADDLAIENVEIKIDAIVVSLAQLEIEDVEITIQDATLSLESLVFAEDVEILIDKIDVSLLVNSYGQQLAGDGMDRRAAA